MRKSTSDRLKEIMKERNLRQVDIIKLCEPYCQKYNVKLTKNYLSQYVSGKVAPGQRTLSILAMALNVNEAWLMGFDIPKDRDFVPQSYESPVMEAILTDSEFKDLISTERFIIKKAVDNIQFDSYDLELLKKFKKLNENGKKEAIKRVSELTFIPAYSSDNLEYLGLAAEERVPYDSYTHETKN